MDSINKTQLLERKGWNNNRIKRFLGEPDSVSRRSNGQVQRHDYDVNRVNEAESTPEFQKILDDARQQKERDMERAIGIEASLAQAIKMDLSRMTVPERGSYSETFESCIGQLYNHKNICSGIELGYWERYINFKYKEDLANGVTSITKKIAKERPDLAFQAGIEIGRKLGLANDSDIYSVIDEMESAGESN